MDNDTVPSSGQPPRHEHRNLCLVSPVGLTILDEQVPLLPPCPENDPNGEQSVQEQPVAGEHRRGPEQHQDQGMERMTNPPVGAAHRERNRSPAQVTEAGQPGAGFARRLSTAATCITTATTGCSAIGRSEVLTAENGPSHPRACSLGSRYSEWTAGARARACQVGADRPGRSETGAARPIGTAACSSSSRRCLP